MGERKSKEYLNKIKEKYNVDELYSWSKYNTYKTDPYGYMLKYIRHEKETRQSIYSVSGGIVHDILEEFYLKNIKYDDMLLKYEDKLVDMNIAGLKYNRSDDKKNKATADKYEDNIRLFFKNHIPIKSKVLTEQFVTIKVDKYIFQGYIDFIHKEDDVYIITDWKTSTIYTGKKIDKERGQLVLYAESLIQKGIPIENIKIRWNFLKYCMVEQKLLSIDKETKQHKTSNKNCLRTEWVKEIKSNLNKWLKKEEYDELEIEDILQTAIENNNLDNLPKHIQDNYKVYDCYVEIPLNQEVIDNLKQDITNTLNEIKSKEIQYDELMNDGYKEEAEELFWTNIDATNQFFFSNLCGYSSKQHRPYKEYLDTLNIFVKDDKKDSNSELDDWLNDL